MFSHIVNKCVYSGIWCGKLYPGAGAERKFRPLKWYPDRNFFGDGGGGVVKKIFFRYGMV